MFWRKRQDRDGVDLSEVYDRLEALEAEAAHRTREFDAIQHEWTEWFDKFRRLHARLAKRQQRDENEPGDEPDSPNAGTPNDGVTNPLALRLMGHS